MGQDQSWERGCRVKACKAQENERKERKESQVETKKAVNRDKMHFRHGERET